VGGVLHDADGPTGKRLGPVTAQIPRDVASKTSRYRKVGTREGKFAAAFLRDRNPGNHRLTRPIGQCRLEFRKGQGLDLALGLDLQFQADLACKIDVETGKAADLVGEIERRKVDRREYPQPYEVRQVGPRQALPSIEQDRRLRILRLCPGRKRQGEHERRDNQKEKSPPCFQG
jgi:hypothetical protein